MTSVKVIVERHDDGYVAYPLGSVNHLLDTGQAITGTTTYFPYGEVQSHTGPDTPMQFGLNQADGMGAFRT